MEENLSSDYSSKKSLYSSENSKIDKPKDNNESNNFGLVKIISELLVDICEEGKSNIDSKSALIKSFISKKIPAISIKDYIERILKYSKAFKEIVIIILIYLDTICAKNKIYLNYNNIHKFIFAAFIVAIKFYEDDNYSINYYAKLGGISKKEAINLEYEFMCLIDFKLFVNQKLYEKYYSYLMSLQEDDIEDVDFDAN